MPFNQDTFELLFQRELDMARALTAQAVQTLRYGSFSERRPDLGKMVRCPFCRVRRRINQKCCDAKYATTQRAYSEEKGFHQVEVGERAQTPEQFQQSITKSFMRRLVAHKKHGQTKKFKVSALIKTFTDPFNMDGNPCLCHGGSRINRAVVAAVNEWRSTLPKGLHHLVPMPINHQDVLTFAQRYFDWKQDRRDKAKRRQRDVARRVNLGLAKRGSR